MKITISQLRTLIKEALESRYNEYIQYENLLNRQDTSVEEIDAAMIELRTKRKELLIELEEAHNNSDERLVSEIKYLREMALQLYLKLRDKKQESLGKKAPDTRSANEKMKWAMYGGNPDKKPWGLGS